LRLLLDTSALVIAAYSPERLGKHAAKVIKDTGNVLELSSISITEIAIKASLGKLKFSVEALRSAIKDLDIRILAYNRQHAFEFQHLPPHHKDSFDRMIIAQAAAEQIPVISNDSTFEAYNGLKVIW
jgi:PIN domain nuclease of toxin-antitoxin system